MRRTVQQGRDGFAFDQIRVYCANAYPTDAIIPRGGGKRESSGPKAKGRRIPALGSGGARLHFKRRIRHSGLEWAKDVTGVGDTPLHARGEIFFSLYSTASISFIGDAAPNRDLPEVQALEAFPAYNCAALVDGVLVFKLSEDA